VQDARKYEAGHTYTQRWNHPVFGPGFPARQVARFAFVGRFEDTIRAAVPLFSDEDPDRSGTGTVTSGSAELYRDGEKIGTSTQPGARFKVPGADGSYRLVLTANRDAMLATNSTAMTCEWTFRSARPGDRKSHALPLTVVRYLPSLDAAGNAPAGAFRIPLAVQPQVTTSAVKTLSVDVSYDDGKTWHPAEVNHDQARWTAEVTHPATPGTWVSLRSTLTEESGETGKQTVIRAYQVR
jgi:hypothetical protein